MDRTENEHISEKREDTDLKYEPITPVNKEIEILISLIIQEKMCPEIQVYQEELVKSLSDKVNAQEASINEIPKESQENKLFLDLYKLDLERVKYLMKVYFKVRLQKVQLASSKIQKHSDYIKKENLKHKLSPAEQEFAKRFELMRSNYMKEKFLSKISAQFRDLGFIEHSKKNKSETITVKFPNSNQFVFMKTLKKITSNEDPRIDQEINEDSIFVTPYEKFQ